MSASAEQITIREAEVAQYDSNIATYEAIIAGLPSDWPKRLEQFKGRTDQHQAVTECDAADVELLSQLLYREQCERAVRAEKMERTKAAAILAVLKS
jgi:hypothetical protein